VFMALSSDVTSRAGVFGAPGFGPAVPMP
jgi:hypothetical protein